MTHAFTAEEGSTPLTLDEMQGLIPSYITLRHELNEAEQAAILTADRWAFARRREVLTERFLLELHRRMFRAVWRWAGKFRKSERNLGINHWQIATQLRLLLEDARYWVQHGTYSSDEIAARFHHRLVSIHPFPNGNGRHSRMAADLLAVQLGGRRFSWGRLNLTQAGEARRRYITALRAADRHDIGPLCLFMRS